MLWIGDEQGFKLEPCRSAGAKTSTATADYKHPTPREWDDDLVRVARLGHNVNQSGI